jgi:hypothetical protein
MTVKQAFEAVRYQGDSVMPEGEQHNLRHLVAEVVSRLPETVRGWLLYETSHVFIGGHGQRGEFMDLVVPALEVRDGLAFVRVVFLSEQLGTTSQRRRRKRSRSDRSYSRAMQTTTHRRTDMSAAPDLADLARRSGRRWLT